MKILLTGTLTLAILGAGVAYATDAPPTAPPPPMTAPGGGLGGACKADVAALCQGLAPGGGRIRECLRTHFKELSPPCRESIRENRLRREGAVPPGAAPPPGSAPPSGPPPQG